MRAALELLRRDPQARLFFAAYSQSALGTGIAYVALLALAHDRFRSPWAVSLILMAEFVPSAVLGSVAGALADRYSRRTCLIVADVLRGSAFLALALVGSFEATLALAVVAGVGNALFNPALMAALPALATQQRLAAVNGLYGT